MGVEVRLAKVERASELWHMALAYDDDTLWIYDYEFCMTMALALRAFLGGRIQCWEMHRGMGRAQVSVGFENEAVRVEPLHTMYS